MKEAAKTGLTAMIAAIVVCSIVFGAYLVGAATETHLTLIVERVPVQGSMLESMEQESRSSVPPTSGILLPKTKPAR